LLRSLHPCPMLPSDPDPHHREGIRGLHSPLPAPLQGPVTSVAFDGMGRKMATAGVDGQVRVWDVRTFKPLHSYFSHAPATSLEISQQGLLAVGFGTRVQASTLRASGTG